MVEIRSNLRAPLTGCAAFLALAVALFIGLMIATAGFAVYPPVADIATPLVCDGEAVHESIGASYRPGQYTVSRSIYCLADGPKGERVDITMKAMGVAFLLYSGISFVLLVLLGLLLKRRSRDLLKAPAGGLGRSVRTAGTRTEIGADDGVTIATGPASPADISSILAKVAEAVERGGPNVVVRNMSFDATRGPVGDEGDEPDADPAARLARLKQLYDQGLITAAEYQTKRSEILSGL